MNVRGGRLFWHSVTNFGYSENEGSCGCRSLGTVFGLIWRFLQAGLGLSLLYLTSLFQRMYFL